ncbi:hypothetical protein HY991_01335 [Candidatus Micrarchaeota archaeon]|nr:hypothetical protein [Candidatus Micrarchaeota archaeon]
MKRVFLGILVLSLLLFGCLKQPERMQTSTTVFTTTTEILTTTTIQQTTTTTEVVTSTTTEAGLGGIKERFERTVNEYFANVFKNRVVFQKVSFTSPSYVTYYEGETSTVENLTHVSYKFTLRKATEDEGQSLGAIFPSSYVLEIDGRQAFYSKEEEDTPAESTKLNVPCDSAMIFLITEIDSKRISYNELKAFAEKIAEICPA